MKKGIKIFCILFLLTILFSSCSNTDSFSEKDLEFTVNNVVFRLDQDVAPLLETLGDEYETAEAPSCVYDGMDKTFMYDSVEIYTYPLNGKDLIDEIAFIDSTFETKRGISIGDTKEDLIKAYGEDYTDEGGVYRYAVKKGDLDSPCIYFTMDQDKVVGISLYSASNM
ncbi:MAG TPA: hypothetical protein DDZ89_01135 [Clostridiales bacterium]|nr:hypothetical protein [Clostridiales bacterium]